MKKLLAAILALTMLFALAACGSKTATTTDSPAEPAETAETAAPAETSEEPAAESEGPAAEEYPETGKLVVYMGALEDECIAIGEAFEAATVRRRRKKCSLPFIMNVMSLS